MVGSSSKRLRQKKRTLIIGIWNIQVIKGKAGEITRELCNSNIDIAALSETEKNDIGIEQIGDYIPTHIQWCTKRITSKKGYM